MALSTALEGCVEETLSCLVAAEQAARCVDDRLVRAALCSIVKDEARHAALAWRALAWAVAQSGKSAASADAQSAAKSLRTRVAAAIAAVDPERSVRANAPSGLESLGRLDSATERGVRKAAFEAVDAPLAKAVLGGAATVAMNFEVSELLAQFPGAADVAPAVVAAVF